MTPSWQKPECFVPPVHQHKDGKWWVWDERYAEEYGPFNTKEKATEAMKDYYDEWVQ